MFLLPRNRSHLLLSTCVKHQPLFSPQSTVTLNVQASGNVILTDADGKLRTNNRLASVEASTPSKSPSNRSSSSSIMPRLIFKADELDEDATHSIRSRRHRTPDQKVFDRAKTVCDLFCMLGQPERAVDEFHSINLESVSNFETLSLKPFIFSYLKLFQKMGDIPLSLYLIDTLTQKNVRLYPQYFIQTFLTLSQKYNTNLNPVTSLEMVRYVHKLREMMKTHAITLQSLYKDCYFESVEEFQQFDTFARGHVSNLDGFELEKYGSCDGEDVSYNLELMSEWNEKNVKRQRERYEMLQRATDTQLHEYNNQSPYVLSGDDMTAKDSSLLSLDAYDEQLIIEDELMIPIRSVVASTQDQVVEPKLMNKLLQELSNYVKIQLKKSLDGYLLRTKENLNTTNFRRATDEERGLEIISAIDSTFLVNFLTKQFFKFFEFEAFSPNSTAIHIECCELLIQSLHHHHVGRERREEKRKLYGRYLEWLKYQSVLPDVPLNSHRVAFKNIQAETPGFSVDHLAEEVYEMRKLDTVLMSTIGGLLCDIIASVAIPVYRGGICIPVVVRKSEKSSSSSSQPQHVWRRFDERYTANVQKFRYINIEGSSMMGVSMGDHLPSDVTYMNVINKLCTWRGSMYRVVEYRPLPAVFTLVKQNSGVSLLSYDAVPMLCPPIPWTSSRKGGYLMPKSFVKVGNELFSKIEFKNYFLVHKSSINASKSEQDGSESPALYDNISDFRAVLDSANALGAIPWRIETQILDLVIEVFTHPDKYGTDVLDKLSVAYLLKDEWAPTQPDLFDLYSNNKNSLNGILSQQTELMKSVNDFKTRKAEFYSCYATQDYAISIANHYRDRIIYFPHQIDFRGRFYPISRNFNLCSADLNRSMLVFAKSKPLGPSGFDWLKIHCINLKGSMKRSSLKERLEKANDVLMTDILDSAENPLEGERWWMDSDDPWQLLSTCFEISKVLKQYPKSRFDSSEASNFQSRLPIHQDGSCNGFQHYAALGRDVLGGKAVNLISDGDYPRDCYSDILDVIKAKHAQHVSSDQDVRIKNKTIEISVLKKLEPYLNRKLIKQSVMTTVYGVTFSGAREQISNKLDKEHFTEKEINQITYYLANSIFRSLNELFDSSKRLQVWLTNSSKNLSNTFDRPTTWITPLGLPVLQNYFQESKRPKRFSVDKSRQKNGFPPNFIHSLDSTHLSLTNLEMTARNLTFASIHDSFWTHASSVDNMNEILREAFVHLHSSPIVEELSDHFIQQIEHLDTLNSQTGVIRKKGRPVKTIHPKDIDRSDYARALIAFKNFPSKGDLKLENVLKSKYFFS